MEDKKIILFDGVCHLCNGIVRFLIARDKRDVFRYAPLQSPMGARLMAERAIDPAKVDSIILIEPGVAYFTKSEAALRIGQQLGRLWKVLGLLTYIPKPIRDAVYDLVARKRYKWFGKKEACTLPTPEWKAKFLK